MPHSVVKLQRLNKTHGTSTAWVQSLFPREHNGCDSFHCLVTENLAQILVEYAKFSFKEEASATPEPLLRSEQPKAPGITPSIPGKQQQEKPGITDKTQQDSQF